MVDHNLIVALFRNVKQMSEVQD